MMFLLLLFKRATVGKWHELYDFRLTLTGVVVLGHSVSRPRRRCSPADPDPPRGLGPDCWYSGYSGTSVARAVPTR